MIHESVRRGRVGRSFVKPAGRFVVGIGLSLTLVLAGVESLAAQSVAGPTIRLDPAIECWFHSRFPALQATIEPMGLIAHSRLYFRCSTHPDFYFVDLQTENDRFVGVGPQANEDCPAVHYYVEALGQDFSSNRTEERVVSVTSHTECRRRHPGATWFGGEDPGIVLGATTAGASPLAPGFSDLGIVSFLSSSGSVVAAAGAAGGGSTGAIVAGVAAAAGAGAGIGVLANDNSPSNTQNTVAPPPTPPPSVTTPVTPPPPTPTPGPGPSPSGSLKACFTVDPPDGRVRVGEPLTLDGRCSTGGMIDFEFDFGDGRTRRQSFATAVWRTPGIYDVRLTVSRETTLDIERDTVSRQIVIDPPAPTPGPEPPPPPSPSIQACIQVVGNLAGDQACSAVFVSCSTGTIDSFRWVLDTEATIGTEPVFLSGPEVSHSWGERCIRSDLMTVRLTVSGPDGSSTIEQGVQLLFQKRPPNRVSPSHMDVHIESEGPPPRITVQTPAGARTSDSRSLPVTLGSSAGVHRLEARIHEPTSPFVLHLDFARSERLVPGSLQVLVGRELARAHGRIVLQHTGRESETIQMQYELRP